VVVHADVVGGGEVGRGRAHVAQAHLAEAALEADPALATPERAGGGAGVDVEAVLDQERRLQAAAQVFRALEAEPRGAVLQSPDVALGGGDAAFAVVEDGDLLLTLDGDVQAAIDGDGALSQGGAAGQGGHSGQSEGTLHADSFLVDLERWPAHDKRRSEASNGRPFVLENPRTVVSRRQLSF
jgi:hypothetical protein